MTAPGAAATPSDPVLCSKCFDNYGLRYDAEALGFEHSDPCPQCQKSDGIKLDKDTALLLAQRFFVLGTTHRWDYGASPLIQFNEYHHRKTEIDGFEAVRRDADLLGNATGVGFFLYGPRLWMIGEVEPLKALQDPNERERIVQQIINEYPGRLISTDETLVRLRKGPLSPSLPLAFDSPPRGVAKNGRLDTDDCPVLYASQDLEVCIHECRVTVEDELFVATLGVQRPLRCLDLTAMLPEQHVTEFTSLDMAVHMLFLAQPHSYGISRTIAGLARDEGFDGLIYPSYFSLIRTGAPPFETAYGISVRRFDSYRPIAQALSIPNVAVFGRPIETGLLTVKCVNRLILRRVEYGFCFGPVGG